MYPLAFAPELSLRRGSRHGVHHRQRRGGNFPEFRVPSEEASDAPSGPSVLIALIDPKPLTRQSILEMLATSLPDNVRLLGASNVDELINAVETSRSTSIQSGLTLVILYIRSAGVTDDWVQEQLQLIRNQQAEIPVIMISDRDDANDVITALNYGVRGYIPTSIAAEVAIAALTLIEAGGTYVPADALRSEGLEIQHHPDDHEPAHAPGELNLTSRELAVIDLLREGNANKVIAIKLSMRESTVKVHVRSILKKLRVSNRTHAATVANRLLADARPPERSH
jgi:DNA-binding NarL/FixJ family response regulator